uniref:Aladin seven-bladed propeller domain-containing protein n=1 Tax=Globisporangium ultimum (strain ATCC 200006 / CBS 805.95 / DAOM BR144) TaxID=431595 RepID=K3W7L1_GLOUD
MTWAVPNADAVTLGEMDGELLSVSPRDEAHIGDEFIRRGGTVFPPARVVCTKTRRPFGQEESLTQELDDELDRRPESGAMKLAKHAAGVLHMLLFDDEQKVIRSVVQGAKSAVKSVLSATRGGNPESDDEGNGDEADDVKKTADRLNAIVEDAELDYVHVPRPNAAFPQHKATEESIAAMSWHPTLSLLAVAQQDGVVTFYDVATASWDSRVLEHAAQANITSIEWANYSGGVVAVACRAGILLWKLHCKNKKEDPTLLDIITHPSSKSFHQVTWNADGSMLAAFAKNTNAIYIVDAVFNRKTELLCPYKVASVNWSPTGEYLFVATERGVSLVWETLTWKSEIWDLATRSCGWSRDGRCLLVAARNKNLLYPYAFPGTPPTIDAQISSPPVDFAEKQVFSFDQSLSELVGGKIENIVWDPTGTRVAVTYRSSSPTSIDGNDFTGCLVAIFSVAWEPFLIFTRSGLLRGPPNAGLPRTLGFASSFEQGALLSVGWSRGLITFHPFYFQDRVAQ